MALPVINSKEDLISALAYLTTPMGVPLTGADLGYFLSKVIQYGVKDPLTFDQSHLVDAGGGNWYLPITIGAAFFPAYVTVNGAPLSGFSYDTSTSPARIYGFTNNSTATIQVTVL